MPCLPVVCGCCPFLLSCPSAYVLFPCFFWQSSPVGQIRPDPVCVPSLLQSTGKLRTPVLVPVLVPAGYPIPSSPAAALFSVCSGTDPLRCHAFPQFSPLPVGDRPPRRPAVWSAAPVSRWAVSVPLLFFYVLAISWHYKSR